jgi:sporulation protein YlmC with PRC-barrel domain
MSPSSPQNTTQIAIVYLSASGIYLGSMDRYYTQTVGMPIMTEGGYKLGRVHDIAMNTDTGKIVGFFVDPGGKKVLAPIDVIHWGSALTVHDEEAILESEEIHQVMEALKKGIRVIRNRVVTKSGEDLGQVVDFAVNDKFFTLTKLIVAKNFLGLFYHRKRMIPSLDVIEIKKDRIIVKDPLKTEPLKATTKLRVDTATS